jgi:hypothetical protein
MPSWQTNTAQEIYDEMVQDAEHARDIVLEEIAPHIDAIDSTRIKFTAYQLYAEMKAKAADAAAKTDAIMICAYKPVPG